MDVRNAPAATRPKSAPPLLVSAPAIVAGIDLGDRKSDVCVYSQGKVLERFQFVMTKEGVRKAFEGKAYTRIALEAGAQSSWVTHALQDLGFDPVVANPRKVKAIFSNERKSDKNDALMLAKLCAADESLLHPIQHRSAVHAAALTVMKARDAAVVGRSRLIHTIRSLGKSMGHRFPGSTAEGFIRHAGSEPQELSAACTPIFEMLRVFNDVIRAYDAKLDELIENAFPEAKFLLQVKGVGPVTALAFVLTIGDPSRFASGRIAAAYLGLVPRRDQSGSSDKQLGISKTGNNFVRRLLVQCANHILGPLGRDCDLRRWGLTLAARGGKNARKRTVVAMARKLCVLLFSLWKNAATWQPLFNAQQTPFDTPPTPVIAGLPDTPVLSDCAGRLGSEYGDAPTPARRAPDCSTDGGSDPTMHRVPRDPSTSANRSVDPGMARDTDAGPAPAPSLRPSPRTTGDRRGRRPARAPANVTPTARPPRETPPPRPVNGPGLQSNATEGGAKPSNKSGKKFPSSS